MDEGKNAQRVKDFYVALLEDFPKSAENLVTDDIEWINPLPPAIPFGGTYKGIDGLMEYFRKLNESIEMHPLNFTEFIGSGDTVVAIGVEADTLVIPTGKRYTMPCVHVVRFHEDGRVNQVREYNDITEMLAAFEPNGE